MEIKESLSPNAGQYRWCPIGKYNGIFTTRFIAKDEFICHYSYPNDFCHFSLAREDKDKDGFYKVGSAKINDKIKQYTQKSLAKKNVEYRQGGLYATKDIGKGEELYEHYGIDYWITRIRYTTNYPMTRLFCIMKLNLIKIKGNKIFYGRKKVNTDFIFFQMHISPDGGIVQNEPELSGCSDLEKIKKLISYVSCNNKHEE